MKILYRVSVLVSKNWTGPRVPILRFFQFTQICVFETQHSTLSTRVRVDMQSQNAYHSSVFQALAEHCSCALQRSKRGTSLF